MKAPLIAVVPGGRPAAPRASDTGHAHSAAPFASALHGALDEGRAHASERGVDRRSERADRASHAAERDLAGKNERIDDRARAAAGRAEEKEARADRTVERATRRAAEKAARAASETTPAADGTDVTLPEEVARETDEETTDPAGRSAEAPRGGLPALWALVMGGSLATAPAPDAATGEVGSTATVAVPLVPPVAADATTAIPGTPQLETAAVPASVVSATTASAEPAAGAPPTAATTAPAAATAQPLGGLPAGVTVVPGDATGVQVGASAAPEIVVPTTSPAAEASAAPASPVDDALGAAVPSAVPATPTVAVPVVTSGAAGSADSTVSGAFGSGQTSAEAIGAPVAPVGEGLSADAGAAGQDGGDNAPSGTGTTTQPTVGQAAPVATTATVADVDGATGGAAALPVGSQVARQVAVLAAGPDGEHSMTLVLTPDTLGEVQVQVTLTKGAIELALRGAHEHGRTALLEALPELRRDLEAAGLNPSRLEVARETGSSLLDRQPAQQGFSERGGSHDRGENRSRPWGRPADIGGSGSSNPNRSTSSGVDVLV